MVTISERFTGYDKQATKLNLSKRIGESQNIVGECFSASKSDNVIAV